MSPDQPSIIDELRGQVSSLLDSLDPNTPIAAIALFNVPGSQEPAFLENANSLSRISRSQPGCNGYSLHKTIGWESAPNVKYLIYEEWQSCADFRAQWKSRHLQQFLNSVNPILVSAPDLRVYFGWRENRKVEPLRASVGIWSSALGFSWAMSLFGAQQMVNLISPSNGGNSFQNLKYAAEAELTEPFRAAFRAGDTLQNGILDMTRGGLNGDVFDWSRWRRILANVMQPSAAQPPGASRPGRVPSPVSQPAPSPSAPRPHPLGSWGPMPGSTASHVASPVAPPAPSPLLTPIGEPNISAEFRFTPHYVEVYGCRMHYIEEGSGETILLLHGNPSWSYCWRNIVPHLSSLGRCIAPDLIGYGRSDKPPIQYLWFDHVRYLETFISKMGLENITLVLHDQGSALGFHYAMRHQSNIKAVAFFEALVRPFTWENFSTPEFRDLFRKFRTGGKGGLGWQLIVDQNMFIEQLLPQASGRPLTEAEMNYYREPFGDPRSRLPIWQFPRQTAIGGDPSDVWHAVVEYTKQLKTSSIPKLMLYATPGALLTQEHVEWCQENLKNLKSVNIGVGLHFLEESSPHRIGQEIASWIQEMPCVSKGDPSE
jgi:haloalkane dehalogenase